MNTTGRIGNITKRIDKLVPAETVEDKVKKILFMLSLPKEIRIKYGLIPVQPITQQEWEEYRKRELSLSNDKEATRRKLDDLEKRIDQDGWIEGIEFVLDPDLYSNKTTEQI